MSVRNVTKPIDANPFTSVARTRAQVDEKVTFDKDLMPPDVESRELLCEGLVCSIKLPGKSKSMETPDGTPYVQFGHPVKGGWINFHVFGKPEQRGNKIRVEAKVFKKTMEDGTEYLYLDLHPTDAELLGFDVKTQQVASCMPDLPEGGHSFNCYGKIKGAITFTPIDHDERRAAYEAHKKQQ